MDKALTALRAGINEAMSAYDGAMPAGNDTRHAKARLMNTLFNQRVEIMRYLDTVSGMDVTIDSLRQALEEANGRIHDLKIELGDLQNAPPRAEDTGKQKTRRGAARKDEVSELRSRE